MEHDGGDDDDNVVLEDVNIDVVEDNDNDGTTTMRWRRGRIDDDDVMAMGSQRVLWSGKSVNGTQVPAGRYLARLTARQSNGQQATAVCPLMLH